MATLTLTGNAASLNRLAHQLKGITASTADNRVVTVTLDDADFSVTGPDNVKRSCK